MLLLDLVTRWVTIVEMLTLVSSQAGLTLSEGELVSDVQLARSPILMQMQEGFAGAFTLPFQPSDFEAWQASVGGAETASLGADPAALRRVFEVSPFASEAPLSNATLKARVPRCMSRLRPVTARCNASYHTGWHADQLSAYKISQLAKTTLVDSDTVM
jgi:hypothetical protein